MSLTVELRLDDRPCVVVGGGRVGERRAAMLVAAGAAVTVIATVPSAGVRGLAADGQLSLLSRDFEPGDVAGAFLVVAATDDPTVNATVGEAAARAGALVNRADDAALGDVLMPAVVADGPLRITVSTDGRAPAVTRWAAEQLRAGLDDVLGLDAAAAALLVEVVDEVRQGLGVGRSVDWRTALDPTMLEEIRRGRKAVAKERLKACLSSS